MPQELTVKEAAPVIGLTPDGVKKNIQRGKLPARLVPGIVPHYRIRRTDAETLAREIAARLVRRGRPAATRSNGSNGSNGHASE